MPISAKLAKNYLKKGFSVFPVIITKDEKGKFNKRPAVPWKEYIDRLPTFEEIEEWFGKNNYDGIGLATGDVSGLVVVDVESDAPPHIVEQYRSPMASRTISGGWHFYYKAVSGLRNTVRINNESVDFRGDGGFVVLPPSGLRDSKYSWHGKVVLENVPPLPLKIINELKFRDDKKDKVFEFKGEYPYPEIDGEGNRNNTAAQVAGSIIARLSQNQWDVMGWATFVDWNENHVKPSLPEFELRNTWDSVTTRERVANPTGREVVKQKEGEITILRGNETMDLFNELKAKYGDGYPTGFQKLDNFFKFVPEHIYLISAPTHQGKTTFALNISARMATYGYKILFASLEQGVFIASRVKTIISGEYPESLDLLISDDLVSVDGIIKTVNKMEIKPNLLVIDHLHFMKKGFSKSQTEGIDNMIISLQNMAKKLKLPVIVITHIRKLNADRAPELDDLRDSSSLQQVPSVIMLLYRPKPEVVVPGGSYLDSHGTLIIAKNRITGKTGSIPFELLDSGEFDFNPGQKEITKPDYYQSGQKENPAMNLL